MQKDREERKTQRAWARKALLAILAGACTVAAAAPKAKRAAQVRNDNAPDLVTYGRRDDVMRFADELAERNQLDKAWVETQLVKAHFVPSVAKLIMPPPAGGAKNWAAYRGRFVEPKRIEAGLQFWRANAEALARAEAQYGVPASIIVGIVGVETFYGRITGGFRVLDALASLSFDFPTGRSDRSAFFRGELEQFLLMCQRQQPLDCSEVKGSYAGAIGLPQFMPSSINKLAVDFDGDGRIDLSNSATDAVGSVAHFLAESGWQRGQPTHFPVAAPVDTRERAILLGPDILPSFTAAEFGAHGAVLPPEGQRYPGLLALVELQNGDAAPGYVAGTQNFYAVTRYNWSSYYALAVIELGQAIEQARNAALAGPLRLVSWNAEWLADRASLDAAGYWARCKADAAGTAALAPELPPCDAYRHAGILDSDAYAERKLAPVRSTLAGIVAQGVDVLAVQEVQNAAALQAVLPPGYHVACTTSRPSTQNLAYAVRDALAPLVSCREVPALALEKDTQAHRQRRGLELTIARGKAPLVLLNVHLKSGCASGRMDAPDNRACAILQRQVPPLEAWIEAQAEAGRAFAIVGDVNRDLEAEIRGSFAARSDDVDPAAPLTDTARVRNLWPEINDLQPPTSTMDLAVVDRSAARSHACRGQLDHLALSVVLRGQLDPRTLDADGRLAAQLLPPAPGASDHCLLRAELVFR